MGFREEDGGVKSRKLWFSILTAGLMVVAGKLLAPAVIGDVVAGLVSVCAIYVGGNTASRWVAGNAKNGAAPPVPEPAKAHKAVP